MFSKGQLDLIKLHATSVKNQGEMAVLRSLRDIGIATNTLHIFSDTQWKVIQYCTEECKRQHSGELSVYDMINAWSMVKERMAEDWNPNFKLTISFIEFIGKLVEPLDNKKGFRTIPIGVTDGFGGWIEKANWEDVPRLLTLLLESYYEGKLSDSFVANSTVYDRIGIHPLAKSAEDQFYFEYENIHPFVDGNGRSGKILYNYLRGTLDNPTMPPNFWGGSNP